MVRLLTGCTIDITVIRHPLSWIRRVYARFRTVPNSHYRLKRAAKNESLSDYILREPTVWNFATKFYGSSDVTHFDGSMDAAKHIELRTPSHGTASSLLASAKTRLDSFLFVGVYERLDDAVELLAHRLCW
jgi:hypothetical protein